jgi:hypothetical protein
MKYFNKKHGLTMFYGRFKILFILPNTDGMHA